MVKVVAPAIKTLSEVISLVKREQAVFEALDAFITENQEAMVSIENSPIKNSLEPLLKAKMRDFLNQLKKDGSEDVVAKLSVLVNRLDSQFSRIVVAFQPPRKPNFPVFLSEGAAKECILLLKTAVFGLKDTGISQLEVIANDVLLFPLYHEGALQEAKRQCKEIIDVAEGKKKYFEMGMVKDAGEEEYLLVIVKDVDNLPQNTNQYRQEVKKGAVIMGLYHISNWVRALMPNFKTVPWNKFMVPRQGVLHTYPGRLNGMPVATSRIIFHLERKNDEPNFIRLKFCEYITTSQHNDALGHSKDPRLVYNQIQQGLKTSDNYGEKRERIVASLEEVAV